MDQTMESPLDFLTKLIDLEVITQRIVEDSLGVTLYFDRPRSSSAYNFYRLEHNNSAKDLISEVDFRSPVNIAKAGQELLYISLQPNNKLTAALIIEQYGEPLSIEAAPPQTNAATGVAVNYIYNLGKRDVTFSFSDSPQEVLLDISLERHN